MFVKTLLKIIRHKFITKIFNFSLISRRHVSPLHLIRRRRGQVQGPDHDSRSGIALPTNREERRVRELQGAYDVTIRRQRVLVGGRRLQWRPGVLHRLQVRV